jgi:hypothetical protein
MANPSVGIRFNELDKAQLRELAARLNMSQSNVLRGLVRETLAILKEQDAKTKIQQDRPQPRAVME